MNRAEIHKAHAERFASKPEGINLGARESRGKMGTEQSLGSKKERLCERCSWKRPQFFKVLVGEDFRHRLNVPSAFLGHLTGRETGTATVTDCFAHRWEIELSKGDEGLAFRKGWENFVEDNELKIGEFLVFEYDGYELNFTVTVFDKSACVKNLCALGSSATPSMPVNPGGFHTGNTYHRNRDKNIKKNADGMCSSGKNSNPTFKIQVANPKRGELHVPSYVSGDLLPTERCLVKLQNSVGKQWSVKYIPRKYRTKDGALQLLRSLSGGWVAFSAENRLKKGDTCVFELTEVEHLYQVHVFGKIED